jgi:hypothetical protein
VDQGEDTRVLRACLSAVLHGDVLRGVRPVARGLPACPPPSPLRTFAALAAALPSEAGYVGLLGARRRLEERLAPLRAAGVSDEVLGRVHAPIGLDIGGKSPWAVAVSVIGEIMAERFGGGAR